MIVGNDFPFFSSITHLSSFDQKNKNKITYINIEKSVKKTSKSAYYAIDQVLSVRAVVVFKFTKRYNEMQKKHLCSKTIHKKKILK